MSNSFSSTFHKPFLLTIQKLKHFLSTFSSFSAKHHKTHQKTNAMLSFLLLCRTDLNLNWFPKVWFLSFMMCITHCFSAATSHHAQIPAPFKLWHGKDIKINQPAQAANRALNAVKSITRDVRLCTVTSSPHSNYERENAAPSQTMASQPPVADPHLTAMHLLVKFSNQPEMEGNSFDAEDNPSNI